MSVAPDDTLKSKYTKAISKRLESYQSSTELTSLLSNESFLKGDFENLKKFSEDQPKLGVLIEELQNIEEPTQQKLAVAFIKKYHQTLLRTEAEQREKHDAAIASVRTAEDDKRSAADKTSSSTRSSVASGPSPSVVSPNPTSTGEVLGSSLMAATAALVQPEPPTPRSGITQSGPPIAPAHSLHTERQEEHRRSPHITSIDLDWKQVKEKFKDHRQDKDENSFVLNNRTLVKHDPRGKNISFSSTANPPDLADLSNQVNAMVKDINPSPRIEYSGGTMEQAIEMYRKLAPVVPELTDLKLKTQIEEAAKKGNLDAKNFIEQYQKKQELPADRSRTGPSL